MDSPVQGAVTEILQRWSGGEAGALDRLLPEVYEELRRMASGHLGGDRAGTLQATTLVHDLYLRLLKQQRADFPNRRAFFAYAAGAMRHIVIDHVRARHAEKRGARRERVPVTDDLHVVDASPEELLDLNDALDELATFDVRKAELVQLCAFLGCEQAEAADILGISLSTAKRDFRLARTWLSQRLRRDAAGHA